MATNVGELEATLRLRDELSGQLAKVESRLAGTGRSFDGIAAKGAAFGKVTEGIAGGLTKLGGALGIAFGAAGFVRMISSVVTLGSEIQTMANRTGLSTDALQRLGVVAKTQGSTLEQAAEGVGKFARGLAGGDDSVEYAIQLVRLSLEEMRALNPEQQFLKFAEAAGKIENPITRGKIAVMAFGEKIGKDLSPVLKDLPAQMAAVKDAQIIGPDNIRNLDAASIKLGELNDRWKAFAGNVAAPLVVKGFDELIKLFNWLDAQIDTRFPRGAAVAAGPLAFGEAAGKSLREWFKSLDLGNKILDAILPKLVRLPPTVKATGTAAAESSTDWDDLRASIDRVLPPLDEASRGFDLATEMLRVYREEAVYPLTDAQKALILELNRYEASAAKIADAMRIPEAAVRSTIQSKEAEVKALQDAIDAWEKYAEKQKDVFADVPGIVTKFYDDQITIMHAGNQKMIDALMANPLFKGSGSTDAGQGVGMLEFNIANALDPLPVTEFDTAFQNLQDTIDSINLDPLGAKIERQTVAWAKYNAELLRIQAGLSAVGATASAIGGSRPGGVPLQQPQLVGGGAGYQLPTMAFAAGGIVTRPTMAMVGEAGPEAIIPLGKMGGTNINVAVNVSNSYIPTGSAQFGRDIFAALNEEMKHHGIRIGKA